MSFWEDLKLQYKMGGFEQKLIYWNVGAFVLSVVFFYQFKFGFFDYPAWLALSSDWGVALRNPWTLLTYSFLHAGFLHLLFNMMVLNFAGRLFLTFFSQKQFLGLYLLSAVFAGLVFVGGYYFLQQTASIVGASAAIMAILVATATYSPMMNLRLLLIGNVKLWQFTAVVVFLDLLYIFAENTGGHIAHLAGALFGFIYIKLLQNGTDLSKGINFIFDAVANAAPGKKKTPFKKVHRNESRPKNTSRIVTKDKAQQQIDEILDKISRSGYDSLTAAEKEFLFKAGK